MTEAIVAGRWSVGYAPQNGGTCVLRFDFTDRPPITFAIPQDQVELLAIAILDQGRNCNGEKALIAGAAAD